MKNPTNHPQTSGNLNPQNKQKHGDPDGNRSHQDSKSLVVCPWDVWVRITRELCGASKYIVTEGRTHLTDARRLLEDIIDHEREGSILRVKADAFGNVLSRQSPGTAQGGAK